MLQFFTNLSQTRLPEGHESCHARLSRNHIRPVTLEIQNGSSTLLGTMDFINFIKDEYLSEKPADKEIPALKELTKEDPIAFI